MEIPYYIFLIIYGLGIAALLVGFWLHFYHIQRFGWFDFSVKLNTILFLGVTVIVIGLTALLLKDVPWMETFTLFTKSTSFIKT